MDEFRAQLPLSTEQLSLAEPDGPLLEVAEELLRLDPDGSRWASVIRHAYDSIYNGRETIHWLWRNAPLAPNVLLQLDQRIVIEIFGPRSGTGRLAKLMRSAENLLVNRSAVETVAQQKDSQKRMRSNGGVRSVLAKDGYLVLSGSYDRRIAEELGISVPKRDEYISVRVVPTEDPSGVILINGRYWRKARPDEPSTEPAPEIH